MYAEAIKLNYRMANEWILSTYTKLRIMQNYANNQRKSTNLTCSKELKEIRS